MIIIDLQYICDFTKIFNKISSYQWSIWLDSGIKNKTNISSNQRYDIISAWPYKTIRSNVKHTIVQDVFYQNNLNLNNLKIINKTFQKFLNKNINPFDLVKSLLNTTEQSNKNLQDQPPFWHGALGYFGYDLNQLLYTKIKNNKNNINIPILAVGLYAWALISDHKLKKTYIAYDENYIAKNKINYILKLLNSQIPAPNHHLDQNPDNIKIKSIFSKTNFFKPTQTYQTYSEKFNKIKQYITDGDCYQINYSMLFTGYINNNTNNTSSSISSWDSYQYLRKINPNPFSCYFNIQDNLAILSFSPERFLKIKDNIIKTEPIKGTRKNHSDNISLNKKNITDLLNNPKDRAENIMITDLMRNDLNKHCIPGSVKTLDICKLNSFPTVHHLISTIVGKIKPNLTSLDVFKGCFPGGSITGAPKIRSMEIIQELENTDNNLHRYIYCGSIGYININNNLDMSIAIRTALNYQQTYYYWAGSGIVADSICLDEYNEIFNKIIKT